MTFETNDLAIFGASEGLAAPPPIVAERGPPSPQGTQLGATSVAAPAGEGQGKTVEEVVRDLHAELAAVRAQLALEKAKTRWRRHQEGQQARRHKPEL